MAFYPFEVTIPHIIYACLGGFIVLFGMFSLFLREKLYISEACWAFLFGVIIGPYCADIFNPRSWASPDNDEAINVITLEFTRVILAIGVFAIGVELPKAYMRRHWKSLFFLLVPVMTWGWLVSAAFIYALIPGLNFLTSLAVAACLTPTDPILAAAVIGGKWADKHVPAHIRHLLAAESGCNDGAAFPFLFLALYLLLDHPNTGVAIRDWFLLLWLYQVVLGVVVGAAIGLAFRYLMKFCERMDLIDRHSYVAQYVSMALFTIGVCTLLGSDDLLAAFACGTAFAWDGFFNRQTEESVFSSVIDLLFNIAAFVYVGAWMPFNKFQAPELTITVWRLIVIAILVLLFRRLPIMIACYKWIPDIKNFREAVFSGHFGPVGIGAIFISTLALEIIHRAHKTAENSSNYQQIRMLEETLQPIVAFMVLTSITIHGLSIPSFSLGRRVHSVGRTLSRITTAQSGMQPEWTHSARLVTRGDEKIVINRDRTEIDLERGSDSEKTREGSGRVSLELKEPEGEGTGERLDIRVDGHEVMTPQSNREVQFSTSETPRRQSGGPGQIVEFDYVDQQLQKQLTPPPKAYTPPRRQWSDIEVETPGEVERHQRGDEVDNEEVVSEWKEGNELVIERKRGPQSDPEVTVVRNPEAGTSAVQELGHKLSREFSNVSDTIQHARQKGKNLRRRLSQRSSGASGRPQHIRMSPSTLEKGKQREAPSPTPPSQGEGSGSTPMPSIMVTPNDDEDDGWASEGSATSASKSEEGKHRSRGARIGGHIKNVMTGRRRRGSSVRGREVHQQPGDVEMEQRGRDRSTSRGGGAGRLTPRAGTETPPIGIRQGRGLMPHMPHSGLSTREASPARSVRFTPQSGPRPPRPEYQS
ncbi:Sodium/hydrogen exchanger family-domain-containing protein [Ephemerocybe angulata]|uniref:Sodium/hydrogen exchanger family-domain-containing protein n=1 Tax=Ephemerocybe angulata TaxID=980116 RepID=A0A8H6HXG7_9AGAR|nr:Sodium/hydrogen exchanger family-domain-containing protein [Tulosesus angulatus]